VVAIHQWLDGELSESEARKADARQVAMWSRIAVETDQRRRMTTPAHVAANIMAALPAKEATKQVVVEAAKATSTATFTEAAQAAGLSMTTMFMVGAAMLALGIVVGKVLL
jgi:predicted phage tail protein